MNRVEDWVLENKDKIEKGVEILSKGCEILADTVGQFHPLLEAVFVASAEILSNSDSKEAKYLAEQFENVNKKLSGIRNEIQKLGLEVQQTFMKMQYFELEVQMISQYEMFQEFVSADSEFKQTKKEQFIKHFKITGRDLNLDALYNAVTGNNMDGDDMLKTVMKIEQRSRRAVEKFCTCMKKLFVVGIIALMGYTALNIGAVGDDIVKKWQTRMEDVEKRMKAAVDECIDNFPEQAKMDVEHQLLERQCSVDSEFTKFLLDALVKKYDWVSWSIRVFNDDDFFLWNWLYGKRYHGIGGGVNYFDLLTKNKIMIVVSFTTNPKELDKMQIKDQIETENFKSNMISVAESLCKTLPNCLVHAVSRYKRVEEINNFQPECYYYMVHKRAHICIHSE